MTQRSVRSKEVKLPRSFHRLFAGLLAVTATVGLLLTLIDASIWFFCIPSFTLAAIGVRYCRRHLGPKFTCLLLLGLAALCLVAGVSYCLRDEVALGLGFLVIEAFLCVVNLLRARRQSGSPLFLWLAFGLGFCGLSGFWMTSPEVARWIAWQHGGSASLLDIVSASLVPAVLAGCAGLAAAALLGAFDRLGERRAEAERT